MRAVNLKTNHLTAPVGIDAGPLFLSWQCADGVRQTAYEIQLTANGEMLWHSGKTEGAAMHADVPAVGGSRVSGCWRVRLWDENDVPGAWSEARFETGLAQCDWVGEWVDPETEPIDIPGDDAINAFARPNWERKQAEKEAAGKGAAESYKPHRPASYLRKSFTASKGEARLYITAKGLYAAWLDGKHIGDMVLAPGSFTGNKHAVAYSDTAVVVVSRTGGEGFDVPQSITGPDEYNAQYGGLAQFYDFTTQAEDLDAGKSYLELSNREIAMVDRVCKEFKNVIVVVNSSNAMELGWLDQYDSIKAAVLCGAPGELGFDSLGKILSGEVNPSGHLADTYVYDLLATPTVNNFGGFAYDNYAEVTGSQDNRAMFVNYCEGIYVGYKFYETAAAEGLIDYDKVVQYPFGYGLSYTTFDSSIAAVEDDGEKITLDVAVKNTGDTAGKYVAEIFYEPPYYNGGIEKATANLVQYAKTEILQPGEAQTLKITFRYEDMASYDSNGIKSANGAYVLEAGDYKINLCSDSHTILDTYVAKVDKDVIYDDAHDGARSTDQVAATNQLTFAQGDVTYLSRADGFANYAEATAAPANHSLSAQALADYASAATFDAAKYDDPNAVMPTTGANNGLKLADLSGVAYDDPKWEQLLDELTVNDLFSLTADGGYHTVGVESIGLSATEDCDGPTGVHSNYNPAAGPSYPGTVMLACTWNQPLAKARGEQIAKECAEINCAGWYAPAMNIHRSAFGGRNFEYYSECGVLSGLTAAAEVSGATENGLICYVKHFAFNDQDNYRQNNICTWLNEQSAREIYLKAFEQPIKAGGMGVMTSMNAVGPVWAGGCKALLTNILRDEWGFHGAVITDAVVSAWYMDGNLAIRTGGTKMLAFNITNEFYRDLNSVGTVTAMRNAAHGTLYALANSFAVTRAVAVPKWVKTTYAVDAVVAIILVAWEICAIRKYRKAKKEDEDTEQ